MTEILCVCDNLSQFKDMHLPFDSSLIIKSKREIRVADDVYIYCNINHLIAKIDLEEDKYDKVMWLSNNKPTEFHKEILQLWCKNYLVFDE